MNLRLDNKKCMGLEIIKLIELVFNKWLRIVELKNMIIRNKIIGIMNKIF